MSKEQPREITTEENRYLLLKHFAGLVDYWEKVDERNCREKMEGLLFSVLAALDGCSAGLPGFAIIPLGTEEDIAFAKETGFDYQGLPDLDKDVGGGLHEEIGSYIRGEVEKPDTALYSFGDHIVECSRRFY
jgi:hypothetical protein